MMKKICAGVFVLLALTGIALAQVNQEWVARYNGTANGTDYGRAVGYDAAGNVYTTGYSYTFDPSSGFTTYDIVTVKYNSAGVQQWVRNYNGTGNSSDYAYAIAVDGSGNVHVAGYSYTNNGGINSNDIVTLKYNTSGTLQWARTYNGPYGSSDYGYDIAIDAAGNVYTAGYVYGSSGNADMCVLKYNSAGTLQWTGIYNAPYNSSDYAYSVAVDGSGNVYMGGYGYWSSADYYNYIVVKYNAAGAQQWVANYNGPQNRYDYGRDIGVDAAGNVYMAGYSNYYSISYYAIVTVKWNSGGAFQWAQPFVGNAGTSYYNYGYYLKCTGAGDVYVAGYGYDNNGGTISPDLEIVKYNTAGTQLWSNHYNGPGNSTDQMTSPGGMLALDAAGNAYICGYASMGSATTYYDIVTVKYNSAGAYQWEMRYDNGLGGSPYYYDYGYWVAVDPSNNVYTCGYGYNNNADSYSYDYTTIKYNQQVVSGADMQMLNLFLAGTLPAVNQVWCGASYTPYDTVINNGPGTASTITSRVYIDAWNNSQNIGSLASGTKARNNFTAWAASTTPGTVHARRDTTYAASPSDPNVANNLVTANYTAVYDGQAVSIDQPPDQVWTSYTYTPTATVRNNSAAGTATFTITCTITPGAYSSTRTATNLGFGSQTQVIFDNWTTGLSAEAVYTVTVTCQTTGDVNTANNTLTKTCNAYGDVGVLEPHYPTPPLDSVYVDTDIFPGVILRNYTGGTTDVFNVSTQVEDDGSHIVYEDVSPVEGLTPNQDREFYAATAWHTPNEVGKHFIIRAFTLLPGDDDPSNDMTEWEAVTIAKPGADVLAKSIDSPGTALPGDTYQPQATVQNIGANPATFWTHCTINQTGFLRADYSDSAKIENLPPDSTRQLNFADWTVGDAGNYLLKIQTTLPGDGHPENDTATLRLSVTGIAESKQPVPTVYSLQSSKPNPFYNTTEIRYGLPMTSNVNLAIYDITGKLVKTLINSTENPGYHRIIWNGVDNTGKRAGAGLYFIRFESAHYTATQKLILITK